MDKTLSNEVVEAYNKELNNLREEAEAEINRVDQLFEEFDKQTMGIPDAWDAAELEAGDATAEDLRERKEMIKEGLKFCNQFAQVLAEAMSAAGFIGIKLDNSLKKIEELEKK